MIFRSLTSTAFAKSLGAAALTSAAVLCAPGAFAQEAPEPETPWFDAFTLSLDEDLPPALEELPTLDWEADSGRWGLTFGIRDEEFEALELDDVSAGAFVNVGDRFRFGGQLRFTSPEDDLFMINPDDEERAPEVKFESSFRF